MNSRLSCSRRAEWLSSNSPTASYVHRDTDRCYGVSAGPATDGSPFCDLARSFAEAWRESRCCLAFSTNKGISWLHSSESLRRLEQAATVLRGLSRAIRNTCFTSSSPYPSETNCNWSVSPTKSNEDIYTETWR